MTEVTEDMIGCLCWFDLYREKSIGILKDITKLNVENSDTYYIDDGGHFHLSCRPVKPDEVKFYNHIGDTNEKVGEEIK